jgi:hypothetical protein
VEGRSSKMQAPDGTRVDPKRIEEKLKMESRFKGGANWFFWIAGLSLINSIIVVAGGRWSFFVGLGITQFIDGLAAALAINIGPGSSTIIKILAFVLNACIAGVFAVFGALARMRHKWVFIVGMVLYAVDGLIFLIVPDIISIGFHLIVFAGLHGGLKASRKLDEMEQSTILAA